MREFWFESDGVRLFAVEDGSGRPVIMLHGGLANHLASMRLIASLAPHFRVIAPDLRASGRSRDAQPLTWDRLADDVALLMHEIDVHRAVVGGISSGSGAAIRFALRYPRMIAGLVIVSPIYGGEEYRLTAQQAATLRMMDEVGSRAIDEGVQVLRPLYGNLPPQILERAYAMIDEFDAASVAATTHFLASGDQPFATASDLRSLTAPTLLVPGDDTLHPPEISELYAAHIPLCTLVEPQKDPWQNEDIAKALGGFCEQTAVW